MIGLIIGLIILAIVSNVTMDEIDHRWSRWFGKVIKSKKIEGWMNPRKSWVNKKSKYGCLQFLLSVPFVFITDFWHLLKFLFLNSIFSIFALSLKLPWESVIIMNLAWGGVWEFTAGVFGLLSDRIKIKELNK